MSNKNFTNNKISEKTAGFTLIETIIAIFVLTIGLIGAAAAITYSLQFTTLSRNVLSAKQIIVGSIEEIEALRNAQRLDFKQIANVGNVDNTGSPLAFSGFSVGFKPVSVNPGPDGVNGTDDDLLGAGVDGVYGTADDIDDISLARQGYQRRITVTNLSNSLKKVEIKVRYAGTNGGIGELTGVCYLNDEARLTR